eukprot:scaffold1318_cov388-Prasinococcus_capsulatus_cf.AAC.46
MARPQPHRRGRGAMPHPEPPPPAGGGCRCAPHELPLLAAHGGTADPVMLAGCQDAKVEYAVTPPRSQSVANRDDLRKAWANERTRNRI